MGGELVLTTKALGFIAFTTVFLNNAPYLFLGASSSSSSSAQLALPPADAAGLVTKDQLVAVYGSLLREPARQQSLSSIIEKIGAMEQEVMKTNMNHDDMYHYHLRTVVAAMRSEREGAQEGVTSIATKVAELSKLLAKLPSLLDKVYQDNRNSVHGVSKRVKDLNELYERKKMAHALFERYSREDHADGGHDSSGLADTVNSVMPGGAGAAAAAAAPPPPLNAARCQTPPGHLPPAKSVEDYEAYMKFGEIWLQRNKFQFATACFRAAEQLTVSHVADSPGSPMLQRLRSSSPSVASADGKSSSPSTSLLLPPSSRRGKTSAAAAEFTALSDDFNHLATATIETDGTIDGCKKPKVAAGDVKADLATYAGCMEAGQWWLDRGEFDSAISCFKRAESLQTS